MVFRGDLLQPLAGHIVEQPTHVLGGDVRLQGPGRVGVTEHHGHVGHVAQHHAFVHQHVAGLAGLAVHRQLGAAQQLQVQAGGGDHDVRFQLFAGLQANAVFGEGIDVVGDDGRFTTTQHLEQVAVGHRAQALVPGVVAGPEVLHVDVVAELAAGGGQQGAAHQARALLGQPVHQTLQADVTGARHTVDHHFRQEAAQFHRQFVALRHGGDVGRRALQHGDVLGVLGHGRHQGHRGGATADHHHFLTAVVEVLRPLLGVYQTPLELIGAGEVRRVAGVVVVVAGAAEQELAGEDFAFTAAFVFHAHGPQTVAGGEVGVDHAALEINLVVDVVFGGGVGAVFADRRAVGEHLGLGPGAEVIAQGVHVGIRPDARITEQVPGAADALAALDQGKAAVRGLTAQVAGRADTGKTGADNQHIKMIVGHCFLQPRPGAALCVSPKPRLTSLNGIVSCRQ